MTCSRSSLTGLLAAAAFLAVPAAAAHAEFTLTPPAGLQDYPAAAAWDPSGKLVAIAGGYDGGSGASTLVLRLTADAAPTAAVSGVAQTQVGQTVSFDASGSTASGAPIASYAWDFDGDGSFTDATGPTVAYAGRHGLKVTLRLGAQRERVVLRQR